MNTKTMQDLENAAQAAGWKFAAEKGGFTLTKGCRRETFGDDPREVKVARDLLAGKEIDDMLARAKAAKAAGKPLKAVPQAFLDWFGQSI